jgi:ATP-grasp domain
VEVLGRALGGRLEFSARDHLCRARPGLSDDPTFGPVIAFGQGDTAVELLDDKALALPPLDLKMAGELIARTRVDVQRGWPFPRILLRRHVNHPGPPAAAIRIMARYLNRAGLTDAPVVEREARAVAYRNKAVLYGILLTIRHHFSISAFW